MRPPGTYVVPTLLPINVAIDSRMGFVVQSDWAKAGRVQCEGPTRVPLPIQEWQWRPSLDDVEAFFAAMTWLGCDPILADNAQLGPWAIDFEATMNQEPVCLGLWSCHEPMRRRGLCIPFLSQGGGRYWAPEDEARVMQLIRAFLTNQHLGKVGHNLAGYDTGCSVSDGTKLVHFNWRGLAKIAWDIDVLGIVGDTMAAHHVLFAELRHNLAFLGSMVSDLGPFKLDVWKDDGDEESTAKADWTTILERPDAKTRIYNLRDCFVTALAWIQLCMEMA